MREGRDLGDEGRQFDKSSCHNQLSLEPDLFLKKTFLASSNNRVWLSVRQLKGSDASGSVVHLFGERT